MRVAVSRSAGVERAVTPLELFFDLVYVFAIGQLSHHLAEHVDLRTGAETLILALAVLYAWYMTAWGANWLEPDRPVVRGLLVGLMFASLLMSVSISEAFGDRAWLFVTGYLLLQVGRAAFLIAALRGRALGRHFVNDLVWELGAGALWVAGAIADGDERLLLWGLAVATTYAGLAALHWLPGRGRQIELEHSEIAGGHLLERFRLFFLIALGEIVLTTGTASTDEPFTTQRLVALVIAFTGNVALWWCYFRRGDAMGAAAVEAADDAGDLGWIGTWTLTLVVCALIAVAVGDELAVAHPGDETTAGFTVLAFGGPALFLAGQTLFLRRVLGGVPRSRVLGVGALAVLALVTAPLSMLAGLTAATAVLVGVGAADSAAAGRLDHPL